MAGKSGAKINIINEKSHKGGVKKMGSLAAPHWGGQ
jgi:hypothetical protein